MAPGPLDPTSSSDEPLPAPLPGLPLADEAPPRGRWAWLAVAVCAVPLVVLAAMVVPWDTAGDDEPTTDTTMSELVPAAAWDGKESMMLPVSASPNSGLVDGQTITVHGEGFPPGVDVGIVMCTSQAAFGGGVAWCDILHFDMVTTDAQGTFTGTHQVRRFLEAGGTRWDCTAGNTDPEAWLAQRAAGTLGPDPSKWSCIIAAGMLTDYDVSGGMPIAFAPDGEPQDPVPLDPSSCAQVQTDAGIVPTCPHLGGGPRPDCPDDHLAVLAPDGSFTCEPAESSVTVEMVPVEDVPGTAPPAPSTTSVTARPAPSTTAVTAPPAPSTTSGTAPPGP